jgi:hypothetical protein
LPPAASNPATVWYQNASAAVPPQSPGTAQMAWVPDYDILPNLGSRTIIGYIWAEVNSDAAGNCPAGGASDPGMNSAGSPYVAIAKMLVKPPAAVAMLAREANASGGQRNPIGGQSQLFGFGVAAHDELTVVETRFLHGLGLAQPTVRVSVGKARATSAAGLPDKHPYYSGLLDPAEHFVRESEFARMFKGVVRRDQTQGVIEIAWPKDSAGHRCLIEVSQAIVDERNRRRMVLGSFVIGLQNDAAEPVWC